MKDVKKRLMVVGLLFMMTTLIWAGETQVIVTADTWMNAGAPTTSYAGLTYLWIGPNKSGLVEIDLTGQIPDGMVIKKAELDIWVTYLSANTALEIYRETDPWVEATATWNTTNGTTVWGGSAGGFGTGMAVGSDIVSNTVIFKEADDAHVRWHQFDVTAAAQIWHNDGSLNHGLLLRRGGGGEFKFYSHEGISAPKLNITYDLPDPIDCAQVWERGQGLAADINRDCEVNMIDFSSMAGQWLSCNDPDRAGDPNFPNCQPTW